MAPAPLSDELSLDSLGLSGTLAMAARLAEKQGNPATVKERAQGTRDRHARMHEHRMRCNSAVYAAAVAASRRRLKFLVTQQQLLAPFLRGADPQILDALAAESQAQGVEPTVAGAGEAASAGATSEAPPVPPAATASEGAEADEAMTEAPPLMTPAALAPPSAPTASVATASAAAATAESTAEDEAYATEGEAEGAVLGDGDGSSAEPKVGAVTSATDGAAGAAAAPGASSASGKATGKRKLGSADAEASASDAPSPFLALLGTLGYKVLAAIPTAQIAAPPLLAAAGEAAVEAAAEHVEPMSAAQFESLPWLQVHLKPHQVEGVNWLLASYRHGINCVLADDMGLGKTVQAISFLGYLTLQLKVPGPHLIICPLSVLAPWLAEFRKWAPALRVVRLHTSDREERELFKRETLADLASFDVVLTTYEMAASQAMRSTLCRRIHWRYIVLDEGHRIKNEKTSLYERLSQMPSQGKLLLTGTPLQNNLHELWALLHYLHPEVFAESEAFDRAFDQTRGLLDQRIIAQVGELLGAFVLRRMKAQVLTRLPPKAEVAVFAPMSFTQLEMTKELLQQDSDLLVRMEQGGHLQGDWSHDEDDTRSGFSPVDWRTATNLLSALRKCCNHPFLFDGLEQARLLLIALIASDCF